MRTVLDTSVVLGVPASTIEGELAISVVTVAELHYGVLIAAGDDVRAERLRRLALVEQRFAPLPFDVAVARSYGRLAARLRRAGRRPRSVAMDLLIAATAHANGARLATANAKDLRGLEHELEIVAIEAARG